MIPVPLGTSPTIFPSGAKLSVSLSMDLLSKTLIWCPPCWGKSGRSKTKIPPVLWEARLLYTSA